MNNTNFLKSSAARTLSLAQVIRLSDDQAYQTLREIRFGENGGKPYCWSCGCTEAYEFKTRKLFKCKGCGIQFTLTSGTIFASRKLAIRDILAAIAIFVNGAKGYSALQLSRDLGVQYKTAFVLAHKLREAMGSTLPGELGGEGKVVEVDGAYFGGHVKQENKKEDRKDRRLAINQNGKRQVVAVMRERGGNAMTTVVQAEKDAAPHIVQFVKPETVVHADEASGWDVLGTWFPEVRRINHKKAFSLDGACTNQAESFFSRLRRSEIGIHHHISGHYLAAYASEMTWRENNRRVSNGDQFVEVVTAAAKHPVSRQWKGYWQRSLKAA